MNNKNFQANSKGQFRDIIRYADGTVEVTEWTNNVIVNDVNKAIAYALAQKGGATYWAVGKGLDSWDNTNPPNPSPTDTKLVSEVGRKQIVANNISFLDSEGKPSEAPTNILLIKVTFTSSDCNGDWREFAIVGGGATATKDSGILINHKTHKLISKDSNMEIERQMKFTFN